MPFGFSCGMVFEYTHRSPTYTLFTDRPAPVRTCSALLATPEAGVRSRGSKRSTRDAEVLQPVGHGGRGGVRGGVPVVRGHAPRPQPLQHHQQHRPQPPGAAGLRLASLQAPLPPLTAHARQACLQQAIAPPSRRGPAGLTHEEPPRRLPQQACSSGSSLQAVRQSRADLRCCLTATHSQRRQMRLVLTPEP